MDLIGKVGPTSEKKNCFVIVATYYFTKCVEVKAYKDVIENDVIRFIKEMMIHQFGLPQNITVDNGMVFRLGLAPCYHVDNVRFELKTWKLNCLAPRYLKIQF